MDELLDPLVLIYSSRLVGIVARITDLTQLSDRTPGPQLGPAGRPWSGRSIIIDGMGWPAADGDQWSNGSDYPKAERVKTK